MGHAKLIFLMIRFKMKLAACSEIYLHCQCFKINQNSSVFWKKVSQIAGRLEWPKRYQSENRDAGDKIKIPRSKAGGWDGPG